MHPPDHSARSGPAPAEHLQRIRRISVVMVSVCRMLIGGLPLVFVAFWALADAGQLATQAHLPAAALQLPLPALQRAAAAAVMAMPLVCLLLGVRQAQLCFARFAAGQVFTPEATLRLQRLAGWMAAAALMALLAAMAASVLLTWHQPTGQRHLALGIGSDHLFTLFFAALVWLMAHVIGQGQALAQENAAFV
mgnify:CR=1 FL=1